MIVGAVNGHDAIEVLDTEVLVVTLAASLVVPFTIGVIYKTNNTTSANRRAVAGDGAAGGNWLLGPYTGAYKTYSGAFTTNSATFDTNYHLQLVTQASGDLKNYVDNNTPATTATTSEAPQTKLHIGNDSGGAGEPVTGRIAEVFVYTGVISANDRLALQNYADARYAL